jgi:Zn-dependent metalloprotease
VNPGWGTPCLPSSGARCAVSSSSTGEAASRSGQAWYKTLTERLGPSTRFAAAAEATLDVAEELFPGSDVRDMVENAWRTVEVL